jgi:hypothetical protein
MDFCVRSNIGIVCVFSCIESRNFCFYFLY